MSSPPAGKNELFSHHVPSVFTLLSPCGLWASTCLAVLPDSICLETVSVVRKVNGLPRASFSRNLAVQALPLAMCLAPPPALRDFHPVEFAHAERKEEEIETPKESVSIDNYEEKTTSEERQHSDESEELETAADDFCRSNLKNLLIKPVILCLIEGRECELLL